MHPIIEALLDSALQEVRRREPDYFRHFEVVLPLRLSIPELAPEAFWLGKFAQQEILSSAGSHFAKRGLHLRFAESHADPLADVLLTSACDAFAAAEGLFDLRPAPSQIYELRKILHTDYDTRTTSGGRRYFVRRHGTRPLLLVSALGVPLASWSALLADSSHDLQIVVVESRCGDPVSGGMRSDVDLGHHAADLLEVLDCEALDRVHLLAWCNGGRIAVDLARRCPKRIASVVLTSTTLKGIHGVSSTHSPFEDSLQQIFDHITANPALATPLASMMPRLLKTPDWNAFGLDSARRAAALFALPAKDHATALLAPMTSAEYLTNYARRTAADEAYPTHESLAQLRMARIPLLVILGENDSIISNELLRSALRTHAGRTTEVLVRGAGHYSHDLQYSYFRWALGHFTESLDLPPSPTRLIVSRTYDDSRF